MVIIDKYENLNSGVTFTVQNGILLVDWFLIRC